MSFRRGHDPNLGTNSSESSGYTVYQGSGRHTQIPGYIDKQDMSKTPENNWHSMYDNGDGRRAKPQPNSTADYLSKADDNDGYVATMGEGPMPGRRSGNPCSGIQHLFSVYSDKSSISGIPFIKNTKYLSVRILWTILLVAAVAAMCGHLYRLCETYFEYKTQSKLDLNFSELAFPTVTICNVNAIRRSNLYMASNDLQDLVDNVHPDRLRERVRDWDPEYEEEDEDVSDFDEDNEEARRRRRKRQTQTSSTSSQSVKVKKRTNSFFDDTNTTSIYDDSKTSVDRYIQENTDYSDSWEAESSPATFDAIEEQFTYLYSLENGTTRFAMGHQVQDMLIQCSFIGRKCFQSNFTRIQSSTFGNCYSLEYSKFIVRQSGPRQGLELILYLETDEYIPGITNSKGVQVVLHEPGTVPFPDDEGFSASARTNTFIGLRQIDIKRKGDPFGKCTSTKQFKNTYNKKYTRQTCQKICVQNRIRNRCRCYDGTNTLLNKIIKIPRNLSACSSLDDLECVYDVKWRFQQDSSNCSCNNPCSETQYRKSISTREWPTPAFAKVVSDTLCKQDGDLCEALANKSDSQLQSEFLKLTIFYEDLNHEQITEEADYEEFQFLSDIGGTIGLWIGLSILSIMEIFHLLLAAARYICCGNWRKN